MSQTYVTFLRFKKCYRNNFMPKMQKLMTLSCSIFGLVGRNNVSISLEITRKYLKEILVNKYSCCLPGNLLKSKSLMKIFVSIDPSLSRTFKNEWVINGFISCKSWCMIVGILHSCWAKAPWRAYSLKPRPFKRTFVCQLILSKR